MGGQASPENSTTLFGSAQDLVRAATAKTGQAKTTKATLNETVGQQQITGHGQARYDGSNTALDMTMSVLGQEMEIRLVDRAFYIQFPPTARTELTDGKPWGRVSPDNPMAKALGATLDKAKQYDPSQALEQIQQAGTITKSERTTLDGQPVSHYWVDIDFAKAAASFGSSSGLSTEQLQTLPGKVKTIPEQLWLNQDSLPVQRTEDLSDLVKAAGAPASSLPVIITANYSDWGAPADIQAPPADQVGELGTQHG